MLRRRPVARAAVTTSVVVGTAPGRGIASIGARTGAAADRPTRTHPTRPARPPWHTDAECSRPASTGGGAIVG